jgi:hypothetical protein
MISQYMRRRSAKILLSTPDLLEFEPKGEYVPNPVNLEVYRPMPEIEKSKRILICGNQVKGSRILEFIDPTEEYDCVNTGFEFRFPANVRQLPYVERSRFATFLNEYSSMIGSVGDVISMARLEAMACGLKTFTDFDPCFAKFYGGQNPDRVEIPRAFVEKFHAPEIAVSGLIRIYREISGRS